MLPKSLSIVFPLDVLLPLLLLIALSTLGNLHSRRERRCGVGQSLEVRMLVQGWEVAYSAAL